LVTGRGFSRRCRGRCPKFFRHASASCAAAALGLPLSLHTATRRQGRIRGADDKTLRDASSRATKAFYPALSLCDLIFSGVFERHPRLTLAIVEFELAWAPHLLSTMDYTYRERHGEAIYRFKNGMLPSDFFHRNIVLSFQEDAIGIRLRLIRASHGSVRRLAHDPSPGRGPRASTPRSAITHSARPGSPPISPMAARSNMRRKWRRTKARVRPSFTTARRNGLRRMRWRGLGCEQRYAH
jgi:hypothetical protein